MNQKLRKLLIGGYALAAAITVGAMYAGSQDSKKKECTENIETVVRQEAIAEEPRVIRGEFNPAARTAAKDSVQAGKGNTGRLYFSPKAKPTGKTAPKAGQKTEMPQADYKANLKEVVACAVVGDSKGMDNPINALSKDDEQRAKYGVPRHGFAEFGQLAKVLTVENRDTRVEELKKLLGGKISPELKTKIKQEISKDEFERAKELLYASNVKRVINFIQRPIENANLLNLTEDKSAMAADAVVGCFESILNDMNSFTGYQYEAYRLVKEAAAKYPESKEKKWAEAYVASFENKRKRLAVDSLVKEGDERVKTGDLEGALYSYRFASEFAEQKNPSAKKTLDDKIAKAKSEVAKRKLTAIKANGSEQYIKLLTEMCMKGDKADVPEFKDKELDKRIKFAIAISKDEDEAVNAVKKINIPEASVWLAKHDLKGNYGDEIRNYRQKTAEYIVAGMNPGENSQKYIIEGGVHLLAGGTVEGLGIGYGVSTALRALTVALGNSPVPKDEIVVAAKNLVRKYPDAEFVDEVLIKLAKIYENKGDLEQAKEFYATAAGNSEVSSLENKCVAEIRRLYDKLEKRNKEFAEKHKNDKTPGNYERKEIAGNPLLARALNLDQKLLDGDVKNGELVAVAIEKSKDQKNIMKTWVMNKGDKNPVLAEKELSAQEMARFLSCLHYSASPENSTDVSNAIEYFGGVGYSDKFRAYALGGVKKNCEDTSVGLTARLNQKNSSIGLSAQDENKTTGVYYKDNSEREIGVAHGTDNGRSSDIQKVRYITSKEDGSSRIAPEVSRVEANEKVAVGLGAEHDKGFGAFGTVAFVKNKDAEGANDVVRNKLMAEGRDLIQNTQKSVGTEVNGGYNLGTEKAKAEVVQYLPRDIAVFAGSEGKDLTQTNTAGYGGVKFSLSTFTGDDAEIVQYLNPGLKIEFRNGKLKIYPSIDAVSSDDLKKVYDY